MLTTKDGRFTNGLVGFMNVLLKLEADEKPDAVAVAFDMKTPTFRHKLYDGYKAQRKGMPPELAAQMPILKELLADLGYQMVTCEGWEADDILGTLSAACETQGNSCVIATGDRDSLQLVGPHTRVLLAGTAMGKSITTNMDEAAVMEKYGVTPTQLIDVKSLMGDSSDNIPGVAGVGEKTALSLIQNFGSLEGVYANIEDPRIKKGVREKLLRDKAQAELSRTLAIIDRHAPIDTDPTHYYKVVMDAPAASALLTELEMFSTLNKLHLPTAQQPPMRDPSAPMRPAEILPLPSALAGMVYLCIGDSAEQILVIQNDTVYTADSTSPALMALLCNNEVEKRCFDAKLLYRLVLAQGGRAASITFDAKLAAYLLNPSASEYDIQHLAREYGVQPAFDCVTYPQAALLEGLCAILRSKCSAEGMDALLDEIEMPLAEVLADMEYRGILVDKAGLEAFGRELQAALEQELAAIYEGVGYEFNVNSPKQLGKALFEDLKLPTRKKTKTGWSTSAETLESLRSFSPVIDHILLYRVYQKLNSTYAEGLLKVIAPDGRIHSTFNQTETRTGRISSNEPNLQNIPVRTPLGSQLRKYFIASPGCVLLDADYSQIELRIMAHISGDEHMCQAFLDGEDIHRATAARIYHVPPEDVTPAMRSSVKAINFGIIYGKGPFSLSQDLGISIRDAEAFIRSYLGAYPMVKQYMHDTVEFGKEHGYVATLYGRRRALPELASSNFNLRAQGERIALNTPIQGTAADIIKVAMIRVFRRLRDEGLQARLILQVHDELIVECSVEEQARATAILGEEMRAAAQLRVPLVTEVNSGDTWYAAKG
jgi:DNA polymerase-1